MKAIILIEHTDGNFYPVDANKEQMERVIEMLTAESEDGTLPVLNIPVKEIIPVENTKNPGDN